MNGQTDNSMWLHCVCTRVCACVCPPSPAFVAGPRLCGGWACRMPPRTLGALSGTEFGLCGREGGRWLSSRLVRASFRLCVSGCHVWGLGAVTGALGRSVRDLSDPTLRQLELLGAGKWAGQAFRGCRGWPRLGSKVLGQGQMALGRAMRNSAWTALTEAWGRAWQ